MTTLYDDLDLTRAQIALIEFHVNHNPVNSDDYVISGHTDEDGEFWIDIISKTGDTYDYHYKLDIDGEIVDVSIEEPTHLPLVDLDNDLGQNGINDTDADVFYIEDTEDSSCGDPQCPLCMQPSPASDDEPVYNRDFESLDETSDFGLEDDCDLLCPICIEEIKEEQELIGHLINLLTLRVDASDLNNVSYDHRDELLDRDILDFLIGLVEDDAE